ncbi:MAG: DUF86 domain-containing protein [Bacteroidales bacterium]|nr:DUF86 domain-containing protein [Bacteroidales bacterium]
MREGINDPERLRLMMEAIANIEEFVKDTKTYDQFADNKILCHAVAYNLQCIGECAYKLSREFVASHSDIDWMAIEGLRHVLVHDYYAVNFRTVWSVVTDDLPALKEWLNRKEQLRKVQFV